MSAQVHANHRDNKQKGALPDKEKRLLSIG